MRKGACDAGRQTTGRIWVLGVAKGEEEDRVRITEFQRRDVETSATHHHTNAQMIA